MIPPVKSYRPWAPRQSFLLPPSPLDWLPEGHLAYFILDLVDQTDLSTIVDAIQEKDPRGTRPYDPRMMTALLVYAYCLGVPSSRKIEKATHTDVGFRVIAGGAHPDHSSISEFRRLHLKALAALFVQWLRVCQKAGLVKLGHVALDGTKVQANASKHKAMSYERMQKTEAELRQEVERLLADAERTDHEEGEVHGGGGRGDDVPEELRRRQSRQRKLREAMAALEADAARTRAEELKDAAARAAKKAKEADGAERDKLERAADRTTEKARDAVQKAREKAEARVAQATAEAERAAAEAQTPAQRRQARATRQAQEAAERDLRKTDRNDDDGAGGTGVGELPEHRVPADRDGNPEPTAQRNFTDPDSKIMKRGSEYVQGYNCQLAVDEAHQIIVAEGVSNQAPDCEHLPPMLDRIEANCGAPPRAVTADNGYFSEGNVQDCQARGTDSYIAVGRDKHGSRTSTEAPAPTEPPCKAQMRQKLQTPDGRAMYARRKAVVEPVNGQIKETRGFRRFQLRGIEKVRGEWSLICATHNVLKLFRTVGRGIFSGCGAPLPTAT